ncbi:zinc-dependent peptidase [Caenimonas sedimenti]|uniref:Zinc-dependent peptidase n=1 Tax=Caenimonas sedimenti TaxID=2596921 RepID=A0A562ZKZ5_9BURK|nr:M90 family metallopeptidase [Caenimonas sedimenti]TWO69091.1 zinc-dependent peptidase [Caenimonas sedimenti]
MRGWLRARRPPREIPGALWAGTLAAYPFLAARPAHELQELRSLAARFLADKEFHGADGLVITDAIALAIAAQAVLPVLHLGLDWYDDFVGIVVHPAEVVARRTDTDDDGVVHDYEEVLAGEAMHHGPIMLSWQDVAAAGASADAGYNVVIHEFAHKIDMRDGASDGCPPLPSRAARDAWLATMEAQYQAFREQVIIAERFSGPAPWLDPYGATAIDEFFAVACEAYFVNRERFGKEFAVLVPLFDGFFAPGR